MRKWPEILERPAAKFGVALIVFAIGVAIFPGSPIGDGKNRDQLGSQILTPSGSAFGQPVTEDATANVDDGDGKIPDGRGFVEPVDPNTLFVSPDGSDDNDGLTELTPLASLNTALARVQPGQTVFLMDGEYTETADQKTHYRLETSGTADAWIRIAAAPNATPTLIGSIGTVVEIEGSYVEVYGLTIRGEGFNVDNSFGYGLSIRDTHHVRLVNNTISGMPLNGISAIESSNVEMLNNTVFENSFWSTSQGSGISIWHSRDAGFGPAPDGYHDRIVGNTVYRNENRVNSKWKDFPTITDGNGIIIDENVDFEYEGRTLVANNVIFDNGGRAILVFKANYVDVMFNTTYRNGRTSELLGGPAELVAGEAFDVRFINNFSWARDGLPAMLIDRSKDVESRGNILHTTAPSGSADDADSIITVDPGVRNPSIDETVADFRPLTTGLLTNQAVASTPALSYDAVGTLRDVGSADVGAYEAEAIRR